MKFIKKILTVFTLLICWDIKSSAQQSNYWQQQVNYTINVTLIDTNKMLHGDVTIKYFNNSPDTLNYIYVHLYPNAYKHDRTAYSEQSIDNYQGDFYFSDHADRGYMDSLNFQVNGEHTNYYSSENEPDIARLDLPEPLYPNTSIEITTPFRVKLPKVFSRLGYNDDAFFISQWFPKAAVYDRKGWHPYPYLDQGEFYSNYGQYKVSITLPKNYVVMASGNLETESEEAWLSELATKNEIISDPKLSNKTIVSSEEWKTITYSESNIHDFAWFADKRFIVKKQTVPHFKDSVTIYTAYLPKSDQYWKNSVQYLKTTLDSFGQWIGQYPYKTIKAVEGDMAAGGGMEYPTITIIDKMANTELQTVLVHEAGHNWFYGILGSNELLHPFLDEGINSYYEERLINKHHSREQKFRLIHKPFDFQYHAALGKGQPTNLRSEDYSYLNYGLDIYKKSAAQLYYLATYLGVDEFDRIMQIYYKNWQFKHPTPEDFYETFKANANKPIEWFFNDLLKMNGKFKMSIHNLKKSGDYSFNVIVKNKSGIALPAILNAYDKDTLIAQLSTDPILGTSKFENLIFPNNTTKVVLSPSIPDYNLSNNVAKISGDDFKKTQIGFLTAIKNTYRNRHFITPTIGINNYDGLMLGLGIHNLQLPQKQFQYAITPMYGLKSNELVGAGSVGYTFLPKTRFRLIQLQIDGKTFHERIQTYNLSEPYFNRYIKISPFAEFVLKEPNAIRHITRTLLLKGYIINQETMNYENRNGQILPTPISKSHQYALLSYTFKNDRLINPYGYKLSGHAGKTFAKLSAEGDVFITYNQPKKGLWARGYLGKFISLDKSANNALYYLNTSYTGQFDYLYDGTYFGRTEREGILSRQYEIKEGGAAMPTHLYASPLGRSDNLLFAINLRTSLPLYNFPLRAYLDISTFSNASNLLQSGQKILYSGGLQLHALDNHILINFPLIVSKDYRDYQNQILGKKGFLPRISFSTNLSNWNWLRLTDWLGNKIIKNTM